MNSQTHHMCIPKILKCYHSFQNIFYFLVIPPTRPTLFFSLCVLLQLCSLISLHENFLSVLLHLMSSIILGEHGVTLFRFILWLTIKCYDLIADKYSMATWKECVFVIIAFRMFVTRTQCNCTLCIILLCPDFFKCHWV